MKKIDEDNIELEVEVPETDQMLFTALFSPAEELLARGRMKIVTIGDNIVGMVILNAKYDESVGFVDLLNKDKKTVGNELVEKNQINANERSQI